MSNEHHILLIEDNLEYADQLRALLDEQPGHAFKFERVSSFSEALRQLRKSRYDAILLDFALQDLDCLERISELTDEVTNIPVIGLLDAQDEEKAHEATRHGLQDRIIKHEYDEKLIVSKILFAIKRMQAGHNSGTLETGKNATGICLYHAKTGLPNHVLFKDRLEQAINRAKRDHRQTGLLAVQLERFTPVSDTYGESIGNTILEKATRSLTKSINPGDTVAHVSTDKFMLILDNLEKPSKATMVAEKIVRAFSRTMHIAGQDIKMTANVGIALYPECKGFHELLKSAELAMKRAGDAGGNRYKLFTDHLAEEAIWKYRLENDLARALEQQQFELHYQPMFEMKNKGIIGHEALLRWNHPDEGPMLPGAFINELEASDMILEVGEWVMYEACKKLKSWQSKYSHFIMGINLSARQLQDPYLMERVNTILKKCDVSPEHLEFEITERQLVDKDDSITQYNIRALADLGIILALDDFGTGYSTEEYFQLFPKNTLRTLKIDRTDIKGMMEDEKIAERVKNYIKFSHSNAIRVVAEGVEQQDQLDLLEGLGVDIIQGFLFSKAVTSSQIEDSLRRNEFAHPAPQGDRVIQVYSH